MEEPALVGSLVARLDKVRTEGSHAFWNAYMRGALPFRGVAMRDIRKTVHTWWREEARTLDPVALALELLAQPFGEDKLAGILLLDEIAGDRVGPETLPELARAFDEGHVADWNTCDWLCVKVLGKLVARTLPDSGTARALCVWSDAPGVWRVRASMVGLVRLAPRGDDNFPGFAELMLDTCDRNLVHPHRFVHTGAGWVLRELARADCERVILFLETIGHRLTREGLRKATEAMPSDLQRRLLKANRG